MVNQIILSITRHTRRETRHAAMGTMCRERVWPTFDGEDEDG
jgi:hypothetical protein